jgi:D-alanyl-D-alanine dipeptidase
MFSSPYLDIPIDENDPRGREPLIPLDSVGVAYESYYAKTDGNNPPFGVAIEGSQKDIWLRKSVAEKLARVNELLRPFEAELFVLDGHRSVACQQGLWNFFYTRAKRQNPEGSDEEHRANARLFIVDPVAFDEADSRTWPAHTNGAAVDLTLRDSVTGKLLGPVRLTAKPHGVVPASPSVTMQSPIERLGVGSASKIVPRPWPSSMAAPMGLLRFTV